MDSLAVLTGQHTMLMPLHMDHHDGLVEAVKDGQLWNLWWTAIPTPEMMTEEIQRRLHLLSEGLMQPYTVFRLSPQGRQQIVGMTTLMNIDRTHRVAEIGSTWYAQSAQGSNVNPEAKLLLLREAFENQGFRRIELRTHSMNTHSRRAIEKLGAQYEGTLRRHQIIPNGTIRDTVVYSILDIEWPAVKAGLEHRLNAHEDHHSPDV